MNSSTTPSLPLELLSFLALVRAMIMATGRKMKGQLGDLPSSAISIVALVIVVAAGVLILAGMNESTSNTDAQAIIEAGITGLGTYGDWFGTIIITVIAIVVLSLVMGFFYVRRKGGRA